MRKNKSYWERRAEARINRYTEDAEKTADLIGKAYFQAEQYFEKEAKKVFRGFQNAFELSESEAKRLLNVKPDEKAMDSLRKALEKITDPEERKNALAALSSPAYQYRINRLDKLNEEIAKTCNELYKTELKIDKRFLAAETDKAYKSMMFDIQKGTGISGAFDMLPKSYINQVLNTNWSGEHFSARIWGNTTKLAADLKQDLLVGMLTGQSERDMAASIMERTGTSSFNARRLVRTETTYVTNQAELKSYEEAEIDEYEYSACIDGRTSKLCRELDGKTFKVKDGKPGKNLPPMHPFCRSTTLAVLPSEEELDKAFEDFKADNIPEGMDFDEWLDGLEPTEDGKLVFRDKRSKATVSEGKSDIEIVKGNPLANSEKYLSYSGGKRVDNGGESGISGKTRYNTDSNIIDLDYINSYDFKRKFDSITDNDKVNRQIYRQAKACLIHRNGTNFEDISLIDSRNGDIVARHSTSSKEFEVEYTKKLKRVIKKYPKNCLISIHNHPTNLPPTGSDLVSNGSHRYKLGVVVTHDGKVFVYKAGNVPFISQTFDKTVDKYEIAEYNSKYKAIIRALNSFVESHNIIWSEIK